MLDAIPKTRALCTWAEISAFLRIAESKAKRAEKNMGLPVHRPFGPGGEVRGYPEELEAWQRGEVGK